MAEAEGAEVQTLHLIPQGEHLCLVEPEVRVLLTLLPQPMELSLGAVVEAEKPELRELVEQVG